MANEEKKILVSYSKVNGVAKTLSTSADEILKIQTKMNSIVDFILEKGWLGADSVAFTDNSRTFIASLSELITGLDAFSSCLSGGVSKYQAVVEKYRGLLR